MSFEYDVEEVREGHLTVHINGFSVVDVCYNAEKCTSPLNKEEAEKLANELKIRLESSHPIDTLDEDEYTSGLSELLDLFKEICCDDDCGCD